MKLNPSPLQVRAVRAAVSVNFAELHCLSYINSHEIMTLQSAFRIGIAETAVIQLEWRFVSNCLLTRPLATYCCIDIVILLVRIIVDLYDPCHV